MLNDVLTAPIPEEADSLPGQAAQQFPRAQCDAGMSDTHSGLEKRLGL